MSCILLPNAKARTLVEDICAELLKKLHIAHAADHLPHRSYVTIKASIVVTLPEKEALFTSN